MNEPALQVYSYYHVLNEFMLLKSEKEMPDLNENNVIMLSVTNIHLKALIPY